MFELRVVRTGLERHQLKQGIYCVEFTVLAQLELCGIATAFYNL